MLMTTAQFTNYSFFCCFFSLYKRITSVPFCVKKIGILHIFLIKGTCIITFPFRITDVFFMTTNKIRFGPETRQMIGTHSKVSLLHYNTSIFANLEN